ncbi:hypothetical protein ACJX0J_026420, partial [Zea mays]
LIIILMLPFYQLMCAYEFIYESTDVECSPFYAQVAMFLHVQILQGSIIATDGTPISSGHYVLTFFELTFFDISGALWDEDTFVISLEEGHYAAYIKNYMAMQIIFGSGVATGREEEENKCATLDFYAFPYLRRDMLHLTDIILFLVCAYDANLKQVSFIVADNLILALLLIVADNLHLLDWKITGIVYNLKTVLVGSKNMKTEIYTIPF